MPETRVATLGIFPDRTTKPCRQKDLEEANGKKIPYVSTAGNGPRFSCFASPYLSCVYAFFSNSFPTHAYAGQLLPHRTDLPGQINYPPNGL